MRALPSGLGPFVTLVLVSAGLTAQQTGEEFFENKVRPVFAARCVQCHGAKPRMAGLDLSTVEGVIRGADTGPIVGSGGQSSLLRAVSYTARVKMPPAGKLDDRELSVLLRWIEMGSPLPREAAKASLLTEGPPKRREQHWSFQPVRETALPDVKRASWVRTAIDRFVLARLESAGIEPAPEADKAALLRRATFDLTGLPPSPGEIAEFLADTTPGAFERVVERLLKSPRYGERWARRWLDVARYAETTGADENQPYPHAWRYRDWVIDAFNRDMPYDQFVREQVAGDLLPSPPGGQINVSGRIATGFLALGPKLLAEIDRPKMIYDNVDEQIDTVTKAFLGLSISCARCHDHKFDPITTRDYYSLASIFASVKQPELLETSVVAQPYSVPLVPEGVASKYIEHKKRVEAKQDDINALLAVENSARVARLAPQLGAYMTAAALMYSGGGAAAGAEGLDRQVLEQWVEYLKPRIERRPYLDEWYAADPKDRVAVGERYTAAFQEKVSRWATAMQAWDSKRTQAIARGEKLPPRPGVGGGIDRFFNEVALDRGPFALPATGRDALLSPPGRERLAKLEQELAGIKAIQPPEPPMACGVLDGEPVQQRVFLRGNPANPGEPVARAVPVVLAGSDPPRFSGGSGRLELAGWIASRSNPLTARVMANRIWQWHFGAGIVRTPSNFGLTGEAPTHPELLDFLAGEFVRNGWSIRSLHRLILLSGTYRMGSQASADHKRLDPDNRLWSRFAVRRLEAEEIRDALLSISGELDLTMGGRLDGDRAARYHLKEKLADFDPDQSRRRSVYLPVLRTQLPTFLTLFDFGDATITGEGRPQTNVAPQALYLMNNSFARSRTEALARRLTGEQTEAAARIRQLYQLALGRQSTEAETRAATRYLEAFPGRGNSLEAWSSLCHAVVSSNEFIYAF